MSNRKPSGLRVWRVAGTSGPLRPPKFRPGGWFWREPDGFKTLNPFPDRSRPGRRPRFRVCGRGCRWTLVFSRCPRYARGLQAFTGRVSPSEAPLPSPPTLDVSLRLSGDGATTPRLRPQIRRDNPLNLSILLSGGKETNKDSPSSGERRGKSPALNPRLSGRRGKCGV